MVFRPPKKSTNMVPNQNKASPLNNTSKIVELVNGKMRSDQGRWISSINEELT